VEGGAGRWFRRYRQRVVWALTVVALAVTVAAATLGGFRLHHAVQIERQTMRTQQLGQIAFELADDFTPASGSLRRLQSAFAAVAAHNPDEADRLRTPYLSFVVDRSRQNLRRFEESVDAEVVRQGRESHKVNPSARAALIGAAVAAGLVVLLLVWQFELERRAGRIDRDNASRAVELIRLRDEFFAVVSHELRTPLSSISGYLELINDDGIENLTAAQRANLSVVERGTERLEDLVGELLLVAESERKPLALELSDVDVGVLADHAAEAARPAADARGIELAVAHGRDGVVRGDGKRLGQMLDNLVSNAIKFTPEGGRVTIRAACENGGALFEVVDTGRGLSAGERARLFEPFYRTKDAIAQAVPGTGLGLTITKAIVDAHHGRIDVDSTPKTGTTFRVRIPTARSDA
jgi:signal transduction histidine kinase